MKKNLLLSLFFLLFVSYVNAQETNCGDGLDNDGDGFIDCFDGDCAENPDCEGFYLGNDASCEAEPSAFPVFRLEEGYKSENNVVNNLSRIAIGDLDRDGKPEILTQNKNRNRIFLLNGEDATVKFEATLNNPEWKASMANVQDDGCGEVFLINNSGGFRLNSYDCELNPLWSTEVLPNDPAFVGHADFDGDGQPELYYKDEIRDAVTGTRIVRNAGVNWNSLPGGPIAADILGDDNLELILGNRIYGVNLGNRSLDAGSLTLLATMPVPYKTKGFSYASGQSSTTSVADYNLDGNLDVIVSGATGGDVTSVFLWDVTDNSVQTFNDPFGIDNYQFGWIRGTGRVNIADLDGDGQLNAAFVSGRFLYALDENWDLLWREPVNEETSGITGCTLFDFNGDGQSEVVYRDEDFLYIINGRDGSKNTEIPCRSRTFIEYPIVADVDADRSTEICVVCVSESHNPNGPDPEDNVGARLGLDTPAEVRIYKSAGEPWVPARRLWNQHGYFNVNINDDLSIPIKQQKHQLVFSDGTCSTGSVRPLNTFLNQSPFLSSNGCPTYAAPDLQIVESSFSITPPNCPDQDFTISFDFENIGDIPLTGDVPITFYDGDPLVAGTNKLNTIFIPLSNFEVNQVGSAIDLVVTGTGGPFTLYASLNDNGSTTPTPITFPSSNFLECDYFNNIVSAEVNPIPFELVTEQTNNITCAGGSVPPNGSARVFRLVGGVEVTADYDFFWFNGTTVDATPDYTGAIYSGLSAGTYTVYASDKLAGCSSDTVQVVITDTLRVITADITVDSGNSNCNTPNGQLTVQINGGEPVGNFNYEWYEGNSVGGGLQISNSHIANGLESATYTVLVIEIATGCTTIASIEVPDETVTPVVTASATDIVCSDTNSGSVTASVGGVTTGYSFDWYEGGSEKPTPDYTGSTVNGLAQGSYTVKATNDTSECESALVTVVVDQTIAPEINTISSTENNSCDASNPNGSVSVTIVGDVSDHTIEWYSGTNTTVAPIGTGLSVEGLGGGEYTVKLINNSTGCFVTDRVTVVNNIVQPVLSATSDPVTSCMPLNGRIEATVDLDSTTDYTFSWYRGSVVDAAESIPGTGNIQENLEPGFYTVQAINNVRSCLADAITIEVIDNAIINITQSNSVIDLPTSCQESNGVLEVQANSPSNTSGFDFEWYNGTNTTVPPFFTESGVTTSRATNLSSGIFTVVATDLDNGCSNDQTFNLPYADAHQLVTTAITNATTCNPNDDGEITVNLTPTPLTGFDESNYTLNIYLGEDLTVPPIASLAGVAGTTDYTFTGLGNGNYTIEALADASLDNCAIFTFAEIGLDATYPALAAINKLPDTNCSPATANGSIEVEIDGGALASLYTINWFEGIDTSTPLPATKTAGTNGEIAVDLTGGSYTVEVINNSTACSTIRTYSIVDNEVVISIPTAEIDLTPVTVCGPPNGEAIVNNVYENGMVANISDYRFEWRDASGNLLPIGGPSNTSNSIASLAVGTYTVQAINNLTDCETSTIEFEIENAIVEPTIMLDFVNPERCAISIPIPGELHVTATAPSTTFTYNWYDNETATGPITQTGPDYVNLTPGFYTVEITDQTSNCIYTETYELVIEVNPINLSSSATAVTNCDAPNGSVFAIVTSDGTYSYNWTDADGNSVGTTPEVNSLPAGEYTVEVTDISDAFCQTTATETVVIDQIFPEISLDQVAPLTVCDLSRANGAARARVDGGFVGYTFEWFEGTSATGTVIHAGPDFSEMADITYTLLVTNNLTQCSSEESITITADLPSVAPPSVEILANDTHCVIDNGELRVDVEGNTGNYIFNWFLGSDENGTAFATGDRISNLSAGEYTVVATDTRTGCTSPATTVEVTEDLVYPVLETEIQESICGEDNGQARAFISGGAQIASIEWYNSRGRLVTTGPIMDEVPAGNYTLVVETLSGCIVEEEVEIKSQIDAFNGISRNGDGSNSFFKIACISQYPNNNVKIYNRAGTLVYEANGYDNNTVIFDGVSNRGINVLGANVPDGTYFYVINKNDGSKPVNGYLEIVN